MLVVEVIASLSLYKVCRSLLKRFRRFDSNESGLECGELKLFLCSTLADTTVSKLTFLNMQ